jgi:hypothetical protein
MDRFATPRDSDSAGFVAGAVESAALSPGQTSNPATRNFVEKRIDLRLNEFGERHSFNSLGRNAPPPQPSLNP